MRETSSGNLYIEKYAWGGASITAFSGGNITYATNQRNSGNSWLASNGITLAGDGWMWVQGESDYTQTQGWYQPLLETLISTLATNGFSIGTHLLYQMAVGSIQYGSGVAAAKTAIAAASPSTVKTVTAPLYMNGDNLHQNGRGQVQMGYDAFEAFYGAGHIST